VCDAITASVRRYLNETLTPWLDRHKPARRSSTCEGFDYREAAPQLLMQAFLQRIINGGGRIGREYGLGRKRTDLFIEWPLDAQQGMHGPLQRVVIELNIRRGAGTSASGTEARCMAA